MGEIDRKVARDEAIDAAFEDARILLEDHEFLEVRLINQKNKIKLLAKDWNCAGFKADDDYIFNPEK